MIDDELIRRKLALKLLLLALKLQDRPRIFRPDVLDSLAYRRHLEQRADIHELMASLLEELAKCGVKRVMLFPCNEVVDDSSAMIYLHSDSLRQHLREVRVRQVWHPWNGKPFDVSHSGRVVAERFVVAKLVDLDKLSHRRHRG